MDEDDQRSIETLSGTFDVKYKEGFIYVGKWGFTPSFRAVAYDGVHFCDFSKSQAMIAARTMGYHEEGYKSASHEELRDHVKDMRDRKADDDNTYDIGSAKGPQRLSDLFGKHPAWKTLLASTPGPGAKVYFDFTYNPNLKR